ncbi:MAG TPA: DUF2510 domain-containing protein [Acidimicrobiales bacterium]|jgi:hypothetical protein
MVETHDPAGWFPDPTGTHEMRYWDGYAWLDNVSDQGTTSTAPLGGKPMPPPSQVAARQSQQAQAPTPSKSKTPIIIGAAVAFVVIVAAIFLLTRGGGGGGATAIGDKPVTFTDDGKDATHPAIHTLKVDGNHVVTVTIDGDDPDLIPGVVVETNQNVIDSVNSQISDLSDVLSGQLKDACSNLREEDIGSKGNAVYFADKAGGAGEELKRFVTVPVGGDFEFIAVLVDDKGNCQAGKLTMTLQAIPADLKGASDLSDLASSLSDVSELSDFLSS